MSEIQGGRWDTLLRRLFPVKGPVIAPAISPEIAPCAIVQPYLPELEYLSGVRLGCGQSADAAVSGEFSHVVFENPVGSNVIAVLQDIVVQTAGGALRMAINVAPATGLTLTAKVRDFRWPPGTTAPSTDECVCGVANYTDPIPLGTAMLLWATVATGSERILCRPLVLPPGTCVAVRPTVVNTESRADYYWYERPIEPSEL